MSKQHLTPCEMTVREYFYQQLRASVGALQPELYEVADVAA